MLQFWTEFRDHESWSTASSNTLTLHDYWICTRKNDRRVSSMKRNTQAMINELLAGSVGGATKVLIGQPLDTIKTRAQIAPSKSHLPRVYSYQNFRGYVCKPPWRVSRPIVSQDFYSSERPYGYIEASIEKWGLLRIVQRYVSLLFDDGWMRVFMAQLTRDGQSFTWNCWCQFPPFASYGISKRIIPPFPQLSLKAIPLAGAMAGAANAILASPGKYNLNYPQANSRS